MLFVDNENITDPHLNLALEEYLLRNIAAREEILLFYINEPSIIIGRNQNTLEEINRSYVEEHAIHVVRRLSGGGAVYHDLGNLNFSFISPFARENFNNFKKFTTPVVRVLQALGIPAELGGRNDILVEGRKISGNAQYISGQRMVSHGTLLFHSDLAHVSKALNVKPGKIESKGIKSVRSRVANIHEYLDRPMTTQVFRQHLLTGIYAGQPEIPQYRLAQSDWHAIRRIAEERYMRWEWNYGHSPAFNVRITHRYPFGEIDARIDVQKGLIQSIKFYGDFLGLESITGLEERLSGVRFEPGDLKIALRDLDLSPYFGGLTGDELSEFLYGDR